MFGMTQVPSGCAVTLRFSTLTVQESFSWADAGAEMQNKFTMAEKVTGIRPSFGSLEPIPSPRFQESRGLRG
jgi:hypothetical protein